MKHAVPGLLLFLLALPSMGCLRTSVVELELFISEPALESVAEFPVRVLVDMGTTQNYELHICDWEQGFLETEIEVSTYDKCPEPLTIEGVLIPLVEACNSGALRLTQDWHDAGTLIYGEGSLDVFGTGACNTTEQRQLEIRPVD